MKLVIIFLIFYGAIAYSKSKYSVGDTVIYRYSGEYRDKPIELKEKIISKSGDRLTILVELKDSNTRRVWKQIVTDTPGNRKANKVDKLIEVIGNKEVELSNFENKDLLKLYEGTYIIPESAIRRKKTVHKTAKICDQNVNLTCEIGLQKIKGEDWEAEICESSNFLWTNVSGKFSKGNRVLYKVEVIGCK